MFKISPPSHFPMKYSKLLREYLQTRPNKNKRFFFSEWLEALSEDEFAKLEIQTSLAMEDGEGHMAAVLDMFALCKTAMLAETGSAKKVKKIDIWDMGKKVDAIPSVIAVVALMKKGKIKLEKPIAISSNKPIEYSLLIEC